MSAVGQTRKLRRARGMSVLPFKADLPASGRHVRKVPLAEVAVSFDYLVRCGKQCRGYLKTKRLSGLEVYD